MRVKGIYGSFCVPRQQCDGFLSGTNDKPFFCPRAGQRNLDGGVTLAQDSCCAVVDSIRGTLGCVQKEENSQTACLMPPKWPREQHYVRVGRKRGRSRTLKSAVTSEAIFTIPVSLRGTLTPTMNGAAAKSAILTKAAQTMAPVIPAVSNASLAPIQVSLAASEGSELTPSDFVGTNDVLQDEAQATQQESSDTAQVPTYMQEYLDISTAAVGPVISIPGASTAGPRTGDCADMTESPDVTAPAPVIAYERPALVLASVAAEVSREPPSALLLTSPPTTNILVLINSTMEPIALADNTSPAKISAIDVAAPIAVTEVPCDIQESVKIATQSPQVTNATPALDYFAAAPATADALKATMPPLLSENSAIDVVNNDAASLTANLTTRASQAFNTLNAVSTPVVNEGFSMYQTTTVVLANTSQAFGTASATVAAATALSAKASGSSLLTPMIETPSKTNSSMTTLSDTIVLQSVIATTELPDTSASSVLSGINATSDPSFTSMAQQSNLSTETSNLRSAFEETNGPSSQLANYTFNTSQLTAPSSTLDNAFLETGCRNSSVTGYETAESRYRSNDSATKAGISSLSSASKLLSSSSIPGSGRSGPADSNERVNSGDSFRGRVVASDSKAPARISMPSMRFPPSSSSSSWLSTPPESSVIESLTPPNFISSSGKLQLSPINDDSEDVLYTGGSMLAADNGCTVGSSALGSNMIAFIIVGSLAAVAIFFGALYLRPKRVNPLQQLTHLEYSHPMLHSSDYWHDQSIESEPSESYNVSRTPRAIPPSF